MSSITNNNKQRILTKLNTLLELSYVYHSLSETTGLNKPLLVIILNENCNSLTQELSSMVAKIFESETDYLYRIFPYEYAVQQLREENLFFVHGCSCDKLIFHNHDSELNIFL